LVEIDQKKKIADTLLGEIFLFFWMSRLSLSSTEPSI